MNVSHACPFARACQSRHVDLPTALNQIESNRKQAGIRPLVPQPCNITTFMRDSQSASRVTGATRLCGGPSSRPPEPASLITYNWIGAQGNPLRAGRRQRRRFDRGPLVCGTVGRSRARQCPAGAALQPSVVASQPLNCIGRQAGGGRRRPAISPANSRACAAGSSYFKWNQAPYNIERVPTPIVASAARQLAPDGRSALVTALAAITTHVFRSTFKSTRSSKRPERATHRSSARGSRQLRCSPQRPLPPQGRILVRVRRTRSIRAGRRSGRASSSPRARLLACGAHPPQRCAEALTQLRAAPRPPDYTRGIAAKHIKRGYTLMCQWAGPALLLPVAASFGVSWRGRPTAC